jgi:hypothetical protein
MTTGRPRQSLPETADGTNRRNRKPRSLGASIKQLFREVKRALTASAPAPEPKPRRRRKDDGTASQAGFRLAASKIFRRVAWLPIEAYVTTSIYLWDVFSPWNPWHSDHAEYDASTASHDSDELYPHL